MILFTIIFFAMVVLVVGASAAIGFYVKRQQVVKSLNENNHNQINELPPYRSLFEPDEEELRALEREEKLKLEAKKVEDARQVLAEKIERVHKFQVVWLSEPNKRNTVELLRLASESESAQIFSEMAESVLKVWDDKKLVDLTANDLANLIESHLRILPPQERTSGKLFWLKQEIQSRAAKSEGQQ